MCAISGIINLKLEVATKEKMLRTMKRRGPDASGAYSGNECCLLHSRLCVIDPEGGKQPMELTWQGQKYVITYNGELYNTQQLKRELLSLGHSFMGHSDTEVVVHAYAQWKEAALQRFNGIFAFAVWDETGKRLFLARDRIGVKPLFYCVHNGGLIFSSEIKTILCYPGLTAELDCDGILQILLLGPGRRPGSGVLRGVLELEPGCYAVYEDGRIQTKQYWALRDREHTESFEETADHVRWLVIDAIKRQMISDVPIGTFLSGGLDSSLITAICAGEKERIGERLHTFSVEYENHERYFVSNKFQPESDNRYIMLMEQYFDTQKHHTVLTPDDLNAALIHATRARDLPGMADVDFSLLAFCEKIKEHVTVALSGECADEIFGGYPWYRDPAVRDTAGFPWAQNTTIRAKLLHPDIANSVDAEDYVNDLYRQTIDGSDILYDSDPVDRRMKEMTNLNLRWFMQTLLDRKDRMSMYHGLEVRVPFCDYRIAEYLYSVPWSYKDHNGMEKGLLRYAMRGILPEQILYRKKSPYPKTFDPRYTQLIKNQLMDVMEDSSQPIHQVVNMTQLKKLISAELDWPWYGQLMKLPQTMAYMLQINEWMRMYRIYMR